MWLGSSVVIVLTVCEKSWVRVPVGPYAFSSPVTFGGSVWVRTRAASSNGTVSSVPAWFRADSGTNLIKQGEIVTGRPCGPIAQWLEYSPGLRGVLGSSPGRVLCFFLPCDIVVVVLDYQLVPCISEDRIPLRTVFRVFSEFIISLIVVFFLFFFSFFFFFFTITENNTVTKLTVILKGPFIISTISMRFQ